MFNDIRPWLLRVTQTLRDGRVVAGHRVLFDEKPETVFSMALMLDKQLLAEAGYVLPEREWACVPSLFTLDQLAEMR